ncbi:MAG: adenylosuccinate lyase [Myxococcota bacterium]
MIDRYTRAEIANIWRDESRFSIWLNIELAALAAMEKEGIVPKGTFAKLKPKAEKLRFDQKAVAEIAEIEKTTRHDVIAFLTFVEKSLGKEARWLHTGMTSSDILDTCFCLQLKKSAEIIRADIEKLLSILKRRAFEFKDTVMIGRSHGVHAEPTTFGLVLAIYYDEFRRHLERFSACYERISVGKVSGAVGTFAHIPPSVEERVCKKLGLTPAKASNQIIQRDRFAEFFSLLALIGASSEKMALEVRHLQRTEVGEAAEWFGKGQKGSSAMPHKKNPVLSENITGLARLLRGYALAAIENVALWHERDISHSSVERVIAPDATIVADFILARLAGVYDKLVVYPERMRENLEITRGVIFSQAVLLELVKGGVGRQEAYELVQRNALKATAEKTDLLDMLLSDKALTKIIPPKRLKQLFSVRYYLKHTDYIFNRVFG